MAGFPDSGSIFYEDAYQSLYTVEWETVIHDGVEFLDFTTVTKIPYVWGQMDEGHIQDRQVFRRGICMTQRQIFAPNDDGYEIVAEGNSSVICTFQSTFNCTTKPSDPFLHHLDSYVCDEVEYLVSCGPRFADVDDPNDDLVVFSTVEASGSVVLIEGTQPFQWSNIWSNAETLISDCNPTDITSGT